MMFMIYIAGFILFSVAGSVAAMQDRKRETAIISGAFMGLLWPITVVLALAVAPALAAVVFVTRHRSRK